MTETTREQFLGWQCRIRQISVRKNQGRPEPGMKARITGPDGAVIADGVTVLIIRRDPEPSTSEFRHIVSRTHDPQKRADDAVKLLSSVHYQYPAEFSDRMTALFSDGSATADALLGAGGGEMRFSQFNQTFTLPCSIDSLDTDDPAWRATFWHNHLCNPNLSEKSVILGFTPDWSEADYSDGN